MVGRWRDETAERLRSLRRIDTSTMKITIHQKKPVILDSFREKQEITTSADITILLDSKNEIVIRTDEQGDNYVKIDGHEVWDNSYRG